MLVSPRRSNALRSRRNSSSSEDAAQRSKAQSGRKLQTANRILRRVYPHTPANGHPAKRQKACSAPSTYDGTSQRRSCGASLRPENIALAVHAESCLKAQEWELFHGAQHCARSSRKQPFSHNADYEIVAKRPKRGTAGAAISRGCLSVMNNAWIAQRSRWKFGFCTGIMCMAPCLRACASVDVE